MEAVGINSNDWVYQTMAMVDIEDSLPKTLPDP